MLEWEQYLFQHQTLHNGIYGRFVVKIIFHWILSILSRYVDDIFITINESLENFQIELEKQKGKIFV
jgi:hypothetical protein